MKMKLHYIYGNKKFSTHIYSVLLFSDAAEYQYEGKRCGSFRICAAYIWVQPHIFKIK